MKITEKYTTETERVETSPGSWAYLKVSIFLNEEGQEKKKIGEYIRKYSGFYETFCPFVQNGKEYALYSADYTCTRVMSLPDCKDIGGEDPHAWGFCPGSYYVPTANKEDVGTSADPNGQFAFVFGCVWAAPWELHLLDLSKITEGIIQRHKIEGEYKGWGIDIRSLKLEDAIDMEMWCGDEYPDVYVAEFKKVNLKELLKQKPEMSAKEMEEKMQELKKAHEDKKNSAKE